MSSIISPLGILKFMVSMATHYTILKTESIAPKNIHISAASHPRAHNLLSN